MRDRHCATPTVTIPVMDRFKVREIQSPSAMATIDKQSDGLAHRESLNF